MELDNVLGKLKKLKALYEGAKEIKSEEEANAAAAAIQRLLVQYNISMEEVERKTEKVDNVLEEPTSGYTYKSIGGIWEFRLLTVICKWNFCKCFTLNKSTKNLLIFGKKENLETVKWLRDFLSDKFVYLSKIRFKEYQKTEEYINRPIGKDKYQRSYLVGCADGLDYKLQEESDKDKKEDEVLSSKITSLVVRNKYEIEEYISHKYHPVNGRSFTTKINNSYSNGFNDGKNTELHKQVSSSYKEKAGKVKLLK